VVKGSLSFAYVTHVSSGVREMEILIAPEEYVKLKRGVAYELVPVNANKDYYWKVKRDLRIIK
jgi:putative IMPACT (imprinted ancient) family translation regulator